MLSNLFRQRLACRERYKCLTKNMQKLRRVVLPTQPAHTPQPSVLPKASPAYCMTCANLTGNSQKQTLAHNTASHRFKPGMLSFGLLTRAYRSPIPIQSCLSYEEYPELLLLLSCTDTQAHLCFCLSLCLMLFRIATTSHSYCTWRP